MDPPGTPQQQPPPTVVPGSQPPRFRPPSGSREGGHGGGEGPDGEDQQPPPGGFGGGVGMGGVGMGGVGMMMGEPMDPNDDGGGGGNGADYESQMIGDTSLFDNGAFATPARPVANRPPTDGDLGGLGGGGGGGSGGGGPPGGGGGGRGGGGGHGGAVGLPQVGADGQQLSFLWATGIAVETFKASFKEFLETYRRDRRDAVPSYYSAMRDVRMKESDELEVDFSELALHANILYTQTISQPSECLQMMGNVAEEIFRATQEQVEEDFSLTVAPRNLPTGESLRDLGPQHIDSLISVRGMVVRTSKLIPEVRVAHFECWMCRYSTRSTVDRGRVFEPVRCDHCGKQYTFQLKHNLCIFEDKQVIRVQEAPENLAEGETPVTVSAVVYGTRVDVVVPGDRVVVTGIYRSSPMRLNSNTRIIRAVFRTHLDVVHIDKTSKSNKMADFEDLGNANSAVLDEIHKVARRPDVYDILVRSLAPSIWGHTIVKEGILCLLFGGSQKNFAHGRFRAELNMMMCGDPGVAKSQLLSQVHTITPRGIYTSGRGSSSVGLTAFVVKDTDTGEFVLEPGALVLSDRGVCCIDEFDKMEEGVRSILHEVMEQQTLSIAKAGIIATLNARTSILGAANPKESQWNPNLNVVENLQIEPTLLSRFDLIFLLLDKQDEAEDRLLAGHVLAMYTDKGPAASGGAAGGGGAGAAGAVPFSLSDSTFLEIQESTGEPTLPTQSFTQYIAFAKAQCNPLLTESSCDALRTAFVELRRIRSSGKTVATTMRQLESMIRLAEARAKMRLSPTVTAEDVEKAKTLITTALKDSATDPRTGLINMDMFSGPDPTKNTVFSTMSRLNMLIESKYISQGKKNATVQELKQVLTENQPGMKPLSGAEFNEMLAMMAGGDVVASHTNALVTFV